MVVCKKMCNFEATTLGKVPTITKKNDHRTMATATIDQLQDEIIEEFNGLDEWMDRYAYIIELADTLPPLEECYKTPDNLIAGCQSRVWLHAEVDEQGLLQLQADSDALIVKGIVAMLVRVLGGHTPHEVRQAKLYFIDEIGLHTHLSPTRSNGLLAMLKRIEAYAVAFDTQNNA